MIRCFEWAGSPAAVGEQHGESLREDIVRCLDSMGLLEASVTLSDGRRMSHTDYLARLAAASRQYAPHLFEELEGIARGANVSSEAVMGLNAFLDVIAVCAKAPEAACTAIAAWPPATSGGAVLLAQNLDVDAKYGETIALSTIRMPGRPTVRVLTLPGVVGCLGMNDEGVGLVINFLQASDVTTGVCFPFLVRRILEQARIGDAIGVATLAERGSGAHYLIATRTGRLASIEVSAREHSVVFPRGGYIAHANHYLSPALQRLDSLAGIPGFASSPWRRGSTYVRHAIADQVAPGTDPIDLDCLQSILRDHENYPFSVCFHGADDVSSGCTSATVASVIMEVSSGSLWVSDGSGHSPYVRMSRGAESDAPGVPPA